MHQNAAVMKSLLYIFIGGGTGSVLRYLLTIAIQRQTGTAFPWGTFAVNFLGCILIGVFYTLTSRIHITNELRLLLTIGLCGGFTTFSTFSNESLQLLIRFLSHLLCIRDWQCGFRNYRSHARSLDE